VVDNNDRRGNERVWVGVSDTIGAVPSRWWGAHNGWHAVGNGDIDNPADNRVARGHRPGSSTRQPGSQLTCTGQGVGIAHHPAGSIGNRLCVPRRQRADGEQDQPPVLTPEMLGLPQRDPVPDGT
jgi:hypothetical protein